jgi:uncharacterized protein YbbC (DUF1343 family)
MVLFEGTNVSEGRGTTLPFQLIGAPYIPDSHAFVLGVIATGVNLAGIHLRPVSFQPTFHKWQGQECRGVHVHVTDPSQIRSFALALALIKVCIEQSAGAFAWKHPPYEYEYTRMPIELILGTSEAIAKTLTLPVSDLFWDQGHHTYEQSVQPIHLYP